MIATVLGMGLAPGQETGERPGAAGKERRVGAEVKRILTKRRRGEPLTAEEQGRLKEFRSRRRRAAEQADDNLERLIAGQGAPRERRRPANQPHLIILPAVNLVDRSHFRRARIFLRQGKSKEAIGVLEHVVAKSPDTLAVSVAHYNLARIHAAAPEGEARAREHYKKVATAPLAPRAFDALVRPLVVAGKFVPATEALTALVQAAELAETKVMLIRRMQAAMQRSQNVEAEIAFLEAVPELISYELARKVARVEVLARAEKRKKEEAERQRRESREGPPWAHGQTARRAQGTKPGRENRTERRRRGKGPRKAKHQAKRALEEQDGRQQAIAKLREEIGKLEKAGFFQKAAELKQKVERLGADEHGTKKPDAEKAGGDMF